MPRHGIGTILKTVNGGVGVKNEFPVKQLRLYPNPAKDQIRVETEGLTGISKLILLNDQGQVLMTKNITGSKSEFNISNLLKGIYFVKVINKKEVWVGKMLKE